MDAPEPVTESALCRLLQPQCADLFSASGALLYRVEAQNAEVFVEVLAHDAGRELPEILVGIEFVFLTHLVRKATKLNLRPLRAEVRHPMQNPAYAAFLGTEITVSDKNLLVFSRADAELPFISCNESM